MKKLNDRMWGVTDFSISSTHALDSERFVQLQLLLAGRAVSTAKTQFTLLGFLVCFMCRLGDCVQTFPQRNLAA